MCRPRLAPSAGCTRLHRPRKSRRAFVRRPDFLPPAPRRVLMPQPNRSTPEYSTYSRFVRWWRCGSSSLGPRGVWVPLVKGCSAFVVSVPSQRSGIAYFDQVEALGRRGRTAGATVARREGTGDVAGVPVSETDQFQCAGHVAHLVMQKRARTSANMDLVA